MENLIILQWMNLYSRQLLLWFQHHFQYLITQRSFCCYQHFTLHKKANFCIKNFFSKCDQIRSFKRICSYLLKNPQLKILFFCAKFCERTAFLKTKPPMSLQYFLSHHRFFFSSSFLYCTKNEVFHQGFLQ